MIQALSYRLYKLHKEDNMLPKKQAMKKAQQRIENDLELLQLLNKYIKIKTAAIKKELQELQELR